MSNEWLSQCLTILESIPPRFGQEWTQVAPAYKTLLRSWNEDLAKLATQSAFARCEKMPTIQELSDIAADIESPAPIVEDAWAELYYLIGKHGVYARPVKVSCGDKCYTRYERGAPPFSHPLIADVVAQMGGWLSFFSETPEPLGVTRHQFCEFYASAVTRRKRQIAQYLHLPPAERPERLFPRNWRPFQLPEESDHGAMPLLHSADSLTSEERCGMTRENARQILTRLGIKAKEMPNAVCVSAESEQS